MSIDPSHENDVHAIEVTASMSILEEIHLEIGAAAPGNIDFVQIARVAPGEYKFSGTVAIRVDNEIVGLTSCVSSDDVTHEVFLTREAAENAAIEWAAEQGTETLNVLYEHNSSRAPEWSC